jgi:hypothetical protein
MSRSPRRLTALVAVSLVLAASCGGDDSSSSEADALRAQLAELQQELADTTGSSDTDLQDKLAELEAQIAQLDEGSDASSATSGSSGSPSTDGGITSIEEVSEPLVESDDGLYDTAEEAEAAAAATGCEGSHQMGDRYMPCGEHGELDELAAEADAAPAPEEAPVDVAVSYAPPADEATPESAVDESPEPITYDILQSRRNRSTFDVTVQTAAPGLADPPFGIRSVCIYQYNEYGNSVNGDPKTPCSGPGRKVAVYDQYSKVWKISGSCGVNNSTKDYYDIGIVAHDGRSVLARISDSPC